MKVLFIVPYPTEGASTRYRVEQFIPYLKEKGVKCMVRPFISPRFYKILYKPGKYIEKITYFLICSIGRFEDIFRAFRYDIIFIHLEAFPFGPPFIEYFLALVGKKIIYDLDDAIYLKNASKANQIFKFLKCPSKIPPIIKLSRHVIVCNAYLKNYTQQFIEETKISIIHTSLDTKKFMPRNPRIINKKIVIGWIGSHSTAIYLRQLKNILQKIAEKYDYILRIVGAGVDIKIPNVNIENIGWSIKNDVDNFQNLDIGIYPLSQDEWVRGKTGFKTIQYLSVGIPCVVSNVGSNKDIVQDGINGFLADSDDEWIDKLSLLIESSELRQKMGLRGRNTIEEKYSVKANVGRFLEIIQHVYNEDYKRN